MEDIVTQNDFLIEDGPIYARADSIEFSARVLTFALLAIAFGTDWGAVGIEFWRGVTLALIVGLVLGIISSLLVLALERSKRSALTGRRLARIYAGDPDIVPPAPMSATYRMPCALFLSRKAWYAGILYVTSVGLIFQPNYPRHPWWSRGQPSVPDPLIMGPPRTITIQQGYLTSGAWWTRRIGMPPIPALLCSWETGIAGFRVPRTILVADRLQGLVDELREYASVSGRGHR
jgi:hypothetical protein